MEELVIVQSKIDLLLAQILTALNVVIKFCLLGITRKISSATRQPKRLVWIEFDWMSTVQWSDTLFVQVSQNVVVCKFLTIGNFF